MSPSIKKLVAVVSVLLVAGFASLNCHAQILGLNQTVIHLEGPSQSNDSVVAYNDYPVNGPVNDSTLDTVANFVANTTDGSNTYGSSSMSSTYVIYTRYTYLNVNDSFNYNPNGAGQTNTYMGSDAAGEDGNGGTVDTTSASSGVIFNAYGYIDVLIPGDFTFTFTRADDQGRASVDGMAVAEDNYYTNTGLSEPATATIALSAGFHSFDLLNYQNGGGQNLTFGITPVDGSAFEYTTTAVPEPSSACLSVLGAVGLAGYGYRRRQARA
jgi:hypothetical protein